MTGGGEGLVASIGQAIDRHVVVPILKIDDDQLDFRYLNTSADTADIDFAGNLFEQDIVIAVRAGHRQHAGFERGDDAARQI